ASPCWHHAPITTRSICSISVWSLHLLSTPEVPIFKDTRWFQSFCGVAPMLISFRPPLPAVVAVVLGSSCLWPSLLTAVALLPTIGSAFFVGAPSIPYYSHTRAGPTTRSQQQQQKQQQRYRHHRDPRSPGRGDVLSMDLRMSPKQPHPTKVAFQGEAGAYSEKSLRDLLGNNVVAV
ncbi:unnamed protein product, partial [Laminaria digitata]